MDPRNAGTGAFVDSKYCTIVSDTASFEAIAKGGWSHSAENAASMEGFKTGFRRYGASRLFLIMMQHELQKRVNRDAALSNVCILGADPGIMASGLQRQAPWIIRVFVFKVFCPLILWLNPKSETVRCTHRSASDVLEAAFGTPEGGQLPKDKYFDGRKPFETSGESKDVSKRALVWKDTVRLASLKEGETILVNWN
jgi:hypothetical protein